MKEIALKELSGDSPLQEIITELQFRGERILLPEIITKITKFSDRKEYALKVKKGQLEITEFKI